MKKLFISLATVLMLSMAFTACNKDDNTDPKNNKGNEQPQQKANKSVKVTGIYLTTGQGFTNISKVNLPRLSGNQSVQVGIGANFVNDGEKEVTENDVIVVKTYVNGHAVGGNEIELPAVNIEDGKLLPLKSLYPWTITAADCTGDAITICVEVVRVNNNKLNKKFESKLKIVDGQ